MPSNLDCATPELEIKQVLAAGVPVVLAIETFRALMNANETNFLRVRRRRRLVRELVGHGVGLEGWGELSWEFVNGVSNGVSNLRGAVAIFDVAQ